jgi:hypothetical protein
VNGHFQLSVRELAMNAREYSYKNLVGDPAIEPEHFRKKAA